MWVLMWVFDGVTTFGDIQLSNRSVIDASGVGGGAIDLHGQEVTLTEQSSLVSDTLGRSKWSRCSD